MQHHSAMFRERIRSRSPKAFGRKWDKERKFGNWARSGFDLEPLGLSLFWWLYGLQSTASHPAPFSKSRRGGDRRDQRLFVIANKRKLINPRN